jgi:protein-disulfide isomerase
VSVKYTMLKATALALLIPRGKRRVVLHTRLSCLLLTAHLLCSERDPRLFAQGAPNSAVHGSQKTAEGISQEQADAILGELRQIRQLLEREQLQQRATRLRATSSPSETVQMMVHSQWPALGRDDSLVTIVEFIDLECPFCRRFHSEVFPRLKKNYVDTGKIRFITRDLPLRPHRHALVAAEAARCAGDGGKFWEFRDAILTSVEPPSEDVVLKLAEPFDLDPIVFRTCLHSERHRAEIQADADDAASLQIANTPTFILGRRAKDMLYGVRIIGAPAYADFAARIDEMLEKNR